MRFAGNNHMRVLCNVEYADFTVWKVTTAYKVVQI